MKKYSLRSLPPPVAKSKYPYIRGGFGGEVVEEGPPIGYSGCVDNNPQYHLSFSNYWVSRADNNPFWRQGTLPWWWYFFNCCPHKEIKSRNLWHEIPSKINTGFDKIIELLDSKNIKATFFLGYVAEKNPELIKKAQSRGHEIGCHGYNHNLINNFDHKQFDQDKKRATSIIENITGEMGT